MSDQPIEAVPEPLPAEEEVKLTPQEQYLLAIADEIANDPMGLGYADKSPEEQIELLNSPWYQMVPQQMTARIAMIIQRIDFAPNAAKVEEIDQAVTLAKNVQEVGIVAARKAL